MHDYSQMTIEELRLAVMRIPPKLSIPTPLLYELHHRLWDWIARHPEGFPSKYKWPGWDVHSLPGIPTADVNQFGMRYIQSGCFLCEAALRADIDCGDCPMTRVHVCEDFFKWLAARAAGDRTEFVRLAERIRDCVGG